MYLGNLLNLVFLCLLLISLIWWFQITTQDDVCRLKPVLVNIPKWKQSAVTANDSTNKIRAMTTLSLSLPPSPRPLPCVASITRARTHTLDRERTHTSHPTLIYVSHSFIRLASVSSKWAISHFRTKAWIHLPLQITLILKVISTIFSGISLAKLVRSHDCVEFVCKSQHLHFDL